MRLLAWALGGLGVLVALPGMLWFGYGLYVQWIVARSPATISVIKTAEGAVQLGLYEGGDQVVPFATVAPPTMLSATLPLATPEATPTPRPSIPILPPTRLRIAKVGVDAPVVLADNDNLPRFKGVGWYIGTGYPGFRGNMVLFGHLNGDFETFGRLNELKKDDEVVVVAVDRTYRYIVTETKVVPEDDVAVMAPARDYRVTLITCAGTFYPATRDYSHRLIVTASIVWE